MEVKNFSNTYQAQFYKKHTNPSFAGLTSKLSKAIYDKNDVVELFKNFEPKSHGIIGRLPAKWIYSVPYENRKDNIKSIFNEFGSILAELRDNKDSFIKKLVVSYKLTKLFQKNGVLNKGQIAKVKYISSGNYADVYKLDVKGESFAIKIYKFLMHKGWDIHKTNGNYFEQPLAQYMKGKIPKRNNNWFKFYFGDLKNGIMVSKFEKGKKKFEGTPFNIEKIGILLNKEEQYRDENNIKGIILDNGCVELFPHAKNKTMRYIYSKTLSDKNAPLTILEETLKQKPSQIFNDRLKGVFYSLQLTSNETAKKCLDKLLPAADDEVALFMADNIYYSAYSLRKGIFDSLYARNNKKIDLALAKQLENVECPVTPDSDCVKKLLKRKNPEIDKLLNELYLS